MNAVRKINKSPLKQPEPKARDSFISARELLAILNKKALTPYRDDRFIRLNVVLSKVGLSRSVLYRMIEKERFPSVIKINGSTSVWSENAVNDWMDARKEEAKL
jgi:prophage regulatory protein